ncbi:MAG: WXG100 family type VII secretion target [Anaerolineales bacterium]|nr:WXG100 family type VII secretion target [Anaerolineales bacterium]MCB9126789.1 WXG100 family type VII secretion target [Ardenticatenales bacterium]MCB9172648.1 WXG100 family type VII secretion target [Ardenticatenales bacterium]
MSSYIFQANYDELEAISQRFVDSAQGIDQMLQALRGSRQNLVGAWVGGGAAAFFGAMDKEVLPATERLHDALIEASEVTRRIAHTISRAEAEAAALFRQEADGPFPVSMPTHSPRASDVQTAPQTGRLRLSPTPRVAKQLSPFEEGLVAALGLTSLTTDVLATSLSGAGLLLEATLALVDSPVSPAGDVLGVALYKATIDPIETSLSVTGLITTATTDLIQGNSYFDLSKTEIVIGQDTLVSGAAALGGLFSPEALMDTSINASLLAYDVQGMMGNPVTIAGHQWELHLGLHGHYLVGYPSPSRQ